MQRVPFLFQVQKVDDRAFVRSYGVQDSAFEYHRRRVDVVTIQNALKELSALGLGNAEIVTDNGYYSEDNIARLPDAHFGFVTLTKEFPRIRKKASRNNGLQKGDREKFQRRIYLHIYFNPGKRAEDDEAFNARILKPKKHVEGSGETEELPEREKKQAEKYLVFQKRGKSMKVDINETACAKAQEYHGYFSVVSNVEKDRFKCLKGIPKGIAYS